MLKQHIMSLHTMGYTFVAFSVEAESRYLHAIGVDYTKLRWIDLWVEYQMLLNKNNEYAYGKQLIKGRETFTRPPPPKRGHPDGPDDDEDRGTLQPAETSLVAATYKLLGKHRDSEHKKQMRDLIINGGPFSEQDKHAILEYCADDVEDLPPILDIILDHHQKKLSAKDFAKMYGQMLARGDYAARSAQMVILGYPADIPKIRALMENIPEIKNEVSVDANNVIHNAYGFKPLVFDKKQFKFKKNMKAITTALVSEYPEWPLGANNLASISEDTLKSYTSDRHSFKPTLPSQLSRLQQVDSALRGFEKQRDPRKRSFVEFCGPDGRVRPFFGIYRSQSSRSQPSASGFLFLKSAWIRILVQPHEDCYIGAIDYGAQEFLVAACLSNDMAMMADYASGDPYIAFGKRTGALPADATKKTHKLQREIFKALILGTLYGLGAVKMAAKITSDTETYCSVDQAREYIRLFRTAYPDYITWRAGIATEYSVRGYLQLVDGWTMWGDNDNPLSVQNCPVQGTGAVVMRRAVARAQDKGVRVIKTLHDALYHEDQVANGFQYLDKMCHAMQEAWHEVMGECGFPSVPDIRMEAFAWGPLLTETKGVLADGVTPLETADCYIDERAVDEYNRYKKYLEPVVDHMPDW